jgi:hypothetical protein
VLEFSDLRGDARNDQLHGLGPGDGHSLIAQSGNTASMTAAGSFRLWFRAQSSTFDRPAARRPVGPAYLINSSRTRQRVSTVPGKPAPGQGRSAAAGTAAG